MEYNVASIDPSQFMTLLDTAAKIKRPVLALGSPGVGKTDIINEWGKKNGYKVVTKMLAQMSPGDMSIPYVADNVKSNGTMMEVSKNLKFAIANFLTDLEEDVPTILFLDELTAAPPEMAVSCFQILLEHKFGELNLPKNTLVIAAGNSEDDKAAAFPINTATADRLLICKVVCNTEQWLNWASSCKIETYKGSGEYTIIHPSVISFIKQHPYILSQSDDFDNVKRCSPRAAQRVSEVMYAAEHLSSAELMVLISGWIGTDNTLQFLQDLEQFKNLPNIKELFAAATAENKLAVQRMCPDNVSGLYGLTYSVINYVKSNAPKSPSAKAKKDAAYTNTIGMYIFSILSEIEDILPRNEIATTARCLLLHEADNAEIGYLESILTHPEFSRLLMDDFTKIPTLDKIINNRSL